MTQFDEIVKYLMAMFANEFAKLSFGTPNVKVLETLDTEQQTVKVHRVDEATRGHEQRSLVGKMC